MRSSSNIAFIITVKKAGVSRTTGNNVGVTIVSYKFIIFFDFANISLYVEIEKLKLSKMCLKSTVLIVHKILTVSGASCRVNRSLMVLQIFCNNLQNLPYVQTFLFVQYEGTNKYAISKI